jgi:hypothetical protein
MVCYGLFVLFATSLCIPDRMHSHTLDIHHLQIQAKCKFLTMYLNQNFRLFRMTFSWLPCELSYTKCSVGLNASEVSEEWPYTFSCT